MKGIHIEVVFACAYAMFLISTAALLEWLAGHAHRRSHGYRLRGFTFHEHLDAYQCPNGEYLHRAEADHTLNVVRYRAPALGCNACAMKADCTDSDRGRELVRAVGNWVETEVGRFHRILSLALLVLSAFILVAVWVRRHNPIESVLMAAALAALVGLILLFARALWPRAKKARRRAPILLPMTPWSEGGTPDANKRAEPWS